MPFYEYQCNACGHRLEALQKIADEPLCYCPECGEASLKKLISRAAFRLKGGGWYETDFKNSGAKKDGEQSKTTDEQKAKKDNAGEKPSSTEPATEPTTKPAKKAPPSAPMET